jgi:hypothetical protein
VGLHALDRLPDDEKKELTGRIHAVAYSRMVGNKDDGDFSPSKTGPDVGGPFPSNTFDFKSSPEGPGK